MKKGKTITELAQALEAQQAISKDYLVPTAKLSMTDDNKLTFTGSEKREFSPNNHTHGQIATHAEIPKAYYDRLRIENPKLLATNVNHGFEKQAETTKKSGKPETRMLRTVGNDMRALLSSSYRRLDSFDLLNAVLPTMIESGLQVDSSEITESKLYLKALSPKLTGEINKGDLVQYGIMISNSDVGGGSLRIEPLIYRLVCLNGMISSTTVKTRHGTRDQAGFGFDAVEMFSDKTREVTDAAYWMQINDVVKASLNPSIFEKEITRLKIAAGQKITNFDLPEVVELSMKAVNVSGDKLKENMIAYLANGADGAGLTKYGLANAFTYVAQDDAVSYDSSILLERAGNDIINLSMSQWQRIAVAV
jgi:hypothetical protein